MSPVSKKLILAGACVVVLTASAYFVYQSSRPESPEEVRLDNILQQFSAPGLDYTDPAECVDCHQEATDKWAGSHHALANAPLSETDRKRLLDTHQEILRERGIQWHQHGGKVYLEENDLPPYPVVGSIGITPLIQYLHLAPDGRLQTQDIAWDVEKEEWFSVFEQEDDEEPRKVGEWGHWTGQGMNWDANCAYCHMTEFKKNFDPQTNSYGREWTHMAITCAQCHPGMDTHLAQIRNGNNYFEETLTPTQVMNYCATCHSRRDQLTPDEFVAGDLYEDHFQLTLADAPGLYHPDGQVIGENYVYGSLMMSKMGHKGVTCMDCHDPHTTGHILPFENNALCQRCHGSGFKDAPKIDPVAHSHHPAASTGNLCVECHMPVTYFMGRDGRRDHSFSHPDPLLTMEMDIPNACTACHNTQSNEWALRYTNEWYGEDMNADRREKARLMNDLFEGTSGTGPRLKAALAKEENRYWKSTFISMFRYVPPETEIYNMLLTYLDDPDPMVRSAVVRTIGLESLQRDLQSQLLDDPVREVRISASVASNQFAVGSEQGDTELEAYLRHTADSPVGSLRYGSYWASRGDTEKAEHNIRQAVEFEPINPEVWRLAAIQLHGLGKSEAASEFLRKALQLSPGNAAVLFNMGLLAFENGNTDEALRRLNEAVREDPYYEDAWYNLIVLYWTIEQIPTAESKLQEALKYLPQSSRLNQLSVSLQSRG